MTEQEFAALADTYGSDLAHWPAELTDSANQLLARSANCRDVIAQARQLDRAFETLKAHRAPPGLAGEIAGAVQQTTLAGRLVDWLIESPWRPAAAAAVPVVLGFLVGAGTVEPALTDPFLDLALNDVFVEPASAE